MLLPELSMVYTVSLHNDLSQRVAAIVYYIPGGNGNFEAWEVSCHEVKLALYLPSGNTRLHGRPVLGDLSWLTCVGFISLGSHVLDDLSWVTRPGSHVLGHVSWVTCPSLGSIGILGNFEAGDPLEAL